MYRFERRFCTESQRGCFRKGKTSCRLRLVRGGQYMDERVYKTMSRSGALSIAIGVISIVVGVTSGVLLLISGGRLLAGKAKILF